MQPKKHSGLFSFFGRHAFPNTLSQGFSFEICLEDISIQSLFGRQLPFTDCLVGNFSSDILGSNFSFKYLFVLVEFFLVDLFIKYFLVFFSRKTWRRAFPRSRVSI